MAAAALFPIQGAEFSVLLEGAAERVLADSLMETIEVFGLEMLALTADVLTLGGQLRGKRMIPFVGNDAAAGALIGA